MNRTDLHAWQALRSHAGRFAGRDLSAIFRADGPARFDEMSVQALDVLYDFTRQRITSETLNLLLELARECELPARIAELFAGEPVNNTEGRAAMHMALRNRSNRPMRADGQDVMPEVRAQLAKMREFVTGVHQGHILGFTGARITDVVNIGIGGSDLGIVMATEALARFRNKGIRLHCVSNVDGVELADTLEQINPATTLFIVCSKTFTTQETLANANAAREVLVQLFDSGETPEAIVSARGFRQVSDTATLDSLIERVLAEQPAAVADFRSGQGKAMGFLTGKVMQASGGKANPKIIQELLAKKLAAS